MTKDYHNWNEIPPNCHSKIDEDYQARSKVRTEEIKGVRSLSVWMILGGGVVKDGFECLVKLVTLNEGSPRIRPFIRGELRVTGFNKLSPQRLGILATSEIARARTREQV